MGPAKSTAHRSRPGRWDVPAANEEDTGAPPSQVQAINHPVDKIARASAKNRHTCAHAASTPGCRPASPSSTPQNRPQHNRERRGADAFAFAHSRGLPGLRVVHTVRGWRGPPARPRLTRSSPSSPSQAGRPTEDTHRPSIDQRPASGALGPHPTPLPLFSPRLSSSYLTLPIFLPHHPPRCVPFAHHHPCDFSRSSATRVTSGRLALPSAPAARPRTMPFNAHAACRRRRCSTWLRRFLSE